MESKRNVSDNRQYDMNLLLRNIGEEIFVDVPVVKLDTLENESRIKNTLILALPGIEGTATVFKPLAKHLHTDLTCLQFVDTNYMSIEEMAKFALSNFSPNCVKVLLLAYSYGCLIAMELLHLLEKHYFPVKVVFIDGSPELFKRFTRHLSSEDEDQFQINLLCEILIRYMSQKEILKYKVQLLQQKTFKEKLEYFTNKLQLGMSKESLISMGISIHNKVKALIHYNPNTEKLLSSLTLIKPTEMTVKDIADDYDLSTYFEKPIDIKYVEGNHETILKNEDLITEINNILQSELY